MWKFILLIPAAEAGVISDAPRVSDLALGVLQFLLGIVGIFMLTMLVISGLRYLSAGGDEARLEAAKSSLRYSLIGSAVVFGAMVLVTTMKYIL
ncbi:MAG TPA: hypothetical protein ENJ77_01160, partial [Candidatus Moranbacteria bacterium]|nr:hypothetical protein [Candidatus Moranbacteria bacterium]